MNTIFYLLITVLVISFLAFIHELGHFTVARIFKVPILEFAIGMGPKLFSWKGKTGTQYTLRLFPIGGYVSMEGEEGTSENPMAYNNLSPWKKIAVTVAGPIVNIVFAVVVMFALVITSPTIGSTTIRGFYEGAVSNQQLMADDKVLQIGDVKVNSAEELVYEVMWQGFEAVDVTVERDGKVIVLEDVVFRTVEDQGVILGDPDFGVYPLNQLKDVTFGDYFEQAVGRSWNMVKMVFDSLWGLISGKLGVEAVSGPIGIVEAVGQTATYGWSALANLIVLISMNLGIFNLLPIPALDGGRVVFHLIDGIAGRKIIKKEVEDSIIAVTMMMLLFLMLLISVKDVMQIF